MHVCLPVPCAPNGTLINLFFNYPEEVELAEVKYEEAKRELETAISEIQEI